jgi:DNA polymerase III sliding clamp (beta) subunit (PCNA family)
VPVEDFPVVPDGLALEPNENQQAALAQIVIEAGELARMLDMTAMAVSHESASQTCLSGVLCRWEKTDGVPRFIMVGTDTHRLTKYQARDSSVIGGMIDGGGNQPGGNYDVIVPGEALGNWKKILDACKDDAPVTLSASDKLFQIEATNTQGNAVKFISRIMDGQFPNYEKVIPKAGRGFGFNIEEMQSALQRLALTQPKGNKIIFTLMAGGDASGKILRLTATGEVNTADEDLDVVPELANSNDATGAWEEVHWGLTIIYMRAFLGAAKASLDGKTALMYSSQSAKGFSALSPFSFQIIDGDNEVLDGMTHILMPMQV